MCYCNRARHIIIDTALNKIIKFIYNKREFGRNKLLELLNHDSYGKVYEIDNRE